MGTLSALKKRLTVGTTLTKLAGVQIKVVEV